MKLLVATRNRGKLGELEKLLAAADVVICGLDQFPELPEVVEDGESFSANARKKALECAKAANCLTLADDSGLVVPALGGAPGIRSARYAGEQADDSQNNLKLTAEVQNIPQKQRQAYFQCVVALADPAGRCRTFAGRLDGQIIDQARGEHGFGYDPLFLVPEYGKTLAELSADIKNRISHRGKALEQLLAVLNGSDPFAD